MQAIDTRNFYEIVNSLTFHEQRELAISLMKATHVSDRAIRFWYSGKVKPDYCKRQTIAKVLMRKLKIRTNISILFDGR